MIIVSGVLLLGRIPIFANLFNSIRSGLFSFGDGIGTAYTRVFRPAASIEEELDYYRELAASSAVDTVRLAELESTVAELETLISYKQTLTISSTSARLLGRPSELEHVFVIDKGSDHGIRPGTAVIVEEGFLIGTIVDVDRFTSTVLSIQDARSSIPGAILNTDKTVGMIEGQDGFLMKMRFIPQSETVTEETIIVTSGIDIDLPSGLIIGRVHSVDVEETSVFKEANVQPWFDPQEIRTVFVLDPLQSL